MLALGVDTQADSIATARLTRAGRNDFMAFPLLSMNGVWTTHSLKSRLHRWGRPRKEKELKNRATRAPAMAPNTTDHAMP